MTAKVMSNLDAVGEMVGAFAGMQAGMDEAGYMDGLIRQAHGRAANAFNVAAVATARAGALSHVFEFGTAGITRGPSKYPDGTDPKARLWVHTLTGPGGTKDIGYVFRPAKERNPQPTTAETGVSSQYLAKLSRKKYIFWNRAYVTETGQVVSIRAQSGDFLFVPFYGQPPEDPRNDRGYLMWNSSEFGPILNRPGRTSKGSFTKFWMSWWASEGSQIMTSEMEKYVTMDIETTMAELSKKANSVELKPVQQTNITSAASRAKAFFERLFVAKTAKRENTRTR